MADISQELLSAIRKTFETELKKDKRFHALLKRARDGTSSYVYANSYARLIGRILSVAIKANVSADVLPQGQLYLDIAQNVITPMLKEGHGLTAEYIKLVQDEINRKAEIGLASQIPEFNQDRAAGFVKKASVAESYDDVKWLFEDDAYLQNFFEAEVDEAIQQNADVQWRAGSSPKIIRTYHEGAKYCPWCAELAGTYDYPCDRIVYAKHRDCHCTVDYQVGKFRQDAHTKKIVYRGDIEKLSASTGLSEKEQQLLARMRLSRR